MKKCRDADTNRPQYMCRLFNGAPGFKLDRLPISEDNEVYIDSINGSDHKSVCFFNVSIPDTSSSNCSRIKLEHASNHPREEYVDGLSDNVSATNSESTDIPCKSYIKVFYGSEGRQQHTEPLCRDKLANLEEDYPSTSLFIAYWTTPEESNASFSLRAQCVD